ncbi:uncharacterized protein fam83ga isoform X2 [Halichoeres trimaculatus]|uniref:uncharacterized protein fam83ga isoform X2 n=1 Tax=Halichoeres trimaculatus TaxID=147232 RepID=UPI003D9E13A6
MALSQIQCLDDNHVNPRTHESKPEFLYCEDQRFALEALLHDGREAFFKSLEARGLRGFLSDPELETLAGSVEPYNPDLEVYPEDAEDDDAPLSQHYWPDISDTSVPRMDLGWPDTEAYRGVTRTTVYTQPPLDGHAHIKEILRKMITQAQKVIAVVMDVFTDVDIFRDMLDAGFKRRVAVYILLEQRSLPHFLSMCQRANMHAGHLKNIRVRCTDGAEFLTRSSTKVRGQMGHRFMFIDGDKAVSGSYSFTWMSARLNKNHITVVTGQAADTFDRLFRTLYSNSSSVDLRQVATEPEPEPEPVPQPVPVVPPSAAVARKLYNPKYALVAFGNPATDNKNPKEAEKPEDSKIPEESNKKRRKRQREEVPQEAPPIHPGLDLEKVCLIAYLPIWPEPDPPKDVIGFINIRDAKRPTQVHLQRSEMFETSQAIRFSTPFSMPKEILPEVAKPRQSPAKHEELNKLNAVQDKSKAGESRVDRLFSNPGPDEIKSQVEAATKNSPKCELNKDTTKTPTNQSSGHNSAPQTDANTSNPQTSIPNPWMNRYKSQIISKTGPRSDFSPGTNTGKETGTSFNTQTSNTPSNKEQHTQKQTLLPHLDSHFKTAHTQSQSPTKITPNIPTPAANKHVSSSASPLSENSNSKPLPSSLTQLSPSSPPPNPPLPTSSTSPTPTPPVPKPRTIQLLLKDGITSDGKKLLEGNAAKKSETSTAIQNESAAGAVVAATPKKQPEIVSELKNNSRTQESVKGSVKTEDSPQQKEDGAFQQTMNKEAETSVKAQPGGLRTEKPKVESVNKQEVSPNLSLSSADSKLTKQTKQEAKAAEKNITCHELAKTTNENTTHGERNSEKGPTVQKISDSSSALNKSHVTETVDSTNKKNNTHNTQEPKVTCEGKQTPEKSTHLPLTNSHSPDLRPPAPDRESRFLTAQARTPTPDGLSSPDLRSHTPDSRTLTPDISDGYISAIEDSNLSTTSEEYYECCTSPCLLEPGLDGAPNPGQGTSEDHVSAALASTPKATNVKKSETKSLPAPANAPSSSSVKKEVKQKEDNEKATNKDSKKEEAAPQGAGVKELKERVERKKDSPTQIPKRKKVLNQSAADGGATEGAEPKRLSTGDPKPKTGAEKEKGASVVMRREKTNKETETQKFSVQRTPVA